MATGAPPVGLRGVRKGLPLLAFVIVLLALGPGAPRLRALEPQLALTQYVHDVWRLKDGLPASAVQCLAQTPDGYLWLGTPAGLVRFDGVRFVDVPTHLEDPLRRETILSLAVGPDGMLWIGTRAAGVRRLHDGVLSVLAKENPEDPIRAINVDAQGVIHIGCPTGLYAYGPDHRFARIPTRQPEITAITHDHHGRVWAATFLSVHCFTGERAQTIAVSSVPESMLVDGADQLWLGTYGGLFRGPADQVFNGGNLEQLASAHVWTVYEDRAGSVWVGSTDGLTRFRPGADAVLPRDRLPIPDVIALAEDREGSLWIGTRDGLHRLKDANVTPWTMSEGLLGNVTPSLIEAADGTLYVFSSTEPSGATRFKDGVITHLTGFPDGPSGAAPDGSLWVGTSGLLMHIQGDRIERYGAAEAVPTLWIGTVTTDEQGLILSLASYGGICRWAPGRMQPYVLRDGTVFKVPFHVMTAHRQKDGTLWMGGYDGLWCFRDGEVTRYTTAEGVSAMQSWFEAHPGTETYSRTVVVNEMADRCISSIAEDSDGTLWFASLKGGLTRLKNGRFSPFTTAHGLFSNQLFCVLVDDSHDLWLSCPRGIFRVRGEELEAVAAARAARVTSTVFTTSDGMKNEECMMEYQPAGWKRRDGTLWFATRFGVVSIDPRRLHRNPLPPPVLIEQLTVDGRPVPPGSHAIVPPGADRVEIRYTGLSLLAPERMRFRYRLQGYDRGWTDAGRARVASYVKLPPGDYAFQVTACNNDGVWNETGARIAFRLQPFFYETGWFYGLCGIAAVGSALGAHRWRIRRLRASEMALQQRVNERTAELSRTNVELQREIAERERAEGEVERTHHQLVQASRQAGMAEVATGVLHNVGNVLNSVNVSVTVALNQLRASRAGNVQKIAALLNEHAADPAGFIAHDPRGQRLPAYLSALGEMLLHEQHMLVRELEELRRNVDHIKEIVSMQQMYAQVAGVMEPVPVTEIVEAAIRMTTAALARHEVELVREYAAQPVITTDRHKVLQILVNLLRNAKYACQESGRTDKRIDVAIQTRPERVSIVVRDNGVGIPAENMVRIFSHGFTTRKGGHGFGLHSGAIAAKELGGALRVESPGPTLGATFTLDLPLQPPPSR